MLYLRALKTNTTFKWIGYIFGAIGIIFSGLKIYNEHSKKTLISVEAQQTQNKQNTPNNITFTE